MAGRQSMKNSKAAKERAKAVWNKTGGRGWYCGQWLIEPHLDKERAEQFRWFAIDHILPVRLGGTDEIDNLAPACWMCNCSKGSRTLEDYRIHAGRLAAGIPFFNTEQMNHLALAGFRFPKREPHVFWAESQGL